ncbi:MAG: hypothetical protein WA655_07490 [Candidatus Korobacteraceae bacterium]
MRKGPPEFVICVKNRGYRASLELRKLYQTIPDPLANGHRQIRIVDESGEDYLYPATYFVPVDLPHSSGKAVLRATTVSLSK